MLTKRSTAVIVVAATVFLALAGCSQSTSGTAGKGASSSSASQNKSVTVAFVPKLQGIPYFQAMNTGGEKAAKDLGFTWEYQGPTTADASAQANIVRSFIQKHVSTLFVAPNDPNSMAPLLQQAKAAGIKVATTDTDAPGSVRQLFVQQATDTALGNAIAKGLGDAMKGSGEYAIVSCGQTAQNLNSWIAAEKAYIGKKYPDMKLVDVVYAGERQNMATQMATSLINAHPNLKGLIGQCTSSAPAVAQAVTNANKIGKIFTDGLGTPKSMAPYLKSGASSVSVLWNVENLGYLTGWAGVQLAEGKTIPAKPVVGDIKGITYDKNAHVLLLGDPLLITKDNVGQFNY